MLDNNYLVVTSDHGQLFERGDIFHSTPLLFDSVIHVPLLISAPGSKTHRDIYAPTSAIDILPTFLSLANKEIPARGEGRLLPGFGGQEDLTRSVFSMDAKYDSAFAPFQQATLSMVKGGMKLIYYLGYAAYPDQVELYNLREDIEELENLRDQLPGLAAAMKEELLTNLTAANNLL